MSDTARAEMYEAVGAALPTGRIGEVEDIARAYLYCMTQGYGTGAVINVDGGALLV
jgi:NAD(P)-dependent dehydrogenase (short-subunit alcohol dehydrogenase family)